MTQKNEQGGRIRKTSGGSKPKDTKSLTLAYLEEQLDELNKEVVQEWIARHGVFAARASYMPSDFDGISNWPVVQEPCFIVPASAFTDLVATDKEPK